MDQPCLTLRRISPEPIELRTRFFFALKSEEYFPADKIAINCSSIVLLTPPDLPTHAFFFHFFDKVKNKNFIDDYFQTSDKFSDSLAG